MATVVSSFGIEGVDAIKVEIEASSMGGIPMVSIIGLGDQAVTEAAERLEAALVHAGYKMPSGKAILNLAPGDIRKRGSHYDLGMAIALLQETKQISCRDLPEYAFIGELSLNAGVRQCNGILSMTVAAKEQGFSKVMIPEKNTEEASVIKDIEIIGVSTLKEAIGILEGGEKHVISVKENNAKQQKKEEEIDDFSDVAGQEEAVFAANFMLVAACNPCPCGYKLSGHCTCTDREVFKYRKKISGPIYERIDIQVIMKTFSFFKTGGDSCFREGPNSTKEIRKMVLKAREIQAERYKDYPDINLNCQMHDGMLKKFCVMTPDAESELQDIVKSRKYSARVINRMLRVMRTIADVEGSDIIDMTHVRFAAMLRSELA